MNEEPQVLYCDAWLMAIDKPAGMIVHGDGTGERTLTDYASDLLRPSRQPKDARRRQRQAVSNARQGAQTS